MILCININIEFSYHTFPFIGIPIFSPEVNVSVYHSSTEKRLKADNSVDLI